MPKIIYYNYHQAAILLSILYYLHFVKEDIAVFYESELRFMQNTFRKCRLQSLLIDPHQPLDRRIDLGLYSLLGYEQGYDLSFYDIVSPVKKNTIYKMVTRFSCSYIFLILPDTGKETIFIAGPYLDENFSHSQVLEKAEKLGLTPAQTPLLERYYLDLPKLSISSPLFALFDSFAELIWGSGGFTLDNIDAEFSENFSPLSTVTAEPPPPEKTAWNMQMLEQRYKYENEMMEAVSHGLSHKAEMIAAGFSAASFERRLSDPLRELKNYGIIINTLLRKAAENGGVHPIYIHSVSSDFARKIELLSSTEGGMALVTEMFRTYCRLVRKHATMHFSPPVQKIITLIDSDLTADLSLSALASMQNVSASYLSSLFKQETGQTITDYVNRKRIESAKHLLETTTLQVQTVAQHCGILDVHYFSRVFKKYTGKTPKEYRSS